MNPNSGMLYTVAVVFYNKSIRRLIVYRNSLDDLPPDLYDEHPFEIIGEGGIKQLVVEHK